MGEELSENASGSSYDNLQEEIASVKLSRSILHDRFEEITNEIETYREIRYAGEKGEIKVLGEPSAEKNRVEGTVNKK